MFKGTKIGKYLVMPQYLYYDKFTWVNKETETEVSIGLTDYGQQQLKDIVNVDLPSASQRFTPGAAFISIESISRDYIIKSPFSCLVNALNNKLFKSPEKINEDPFNVWIVRIELLNLSQLDDLIEGDDMIDEITEIAALDEEPKEEVENLEDDELLETFTDEENEEPDSFYEDSFYETDYDSEDSYS